MDEISFEDKFTKIQEIYDQLNVMIKGNGINLVDGDQNLNFLILDLCRKFELKMKSKLSFGVIFDGRYKDDCLIDTLVNEKIGSMLDSKYPYICQGVSSKQDIKIDNKPKDIKTIMIPKDRWQSFSDSVILLSSENYRGFMDKIKLENNYDPDVVVLVLKSVEELQQSQIQSFLSSVGPYYNDSNFLLVLNDVGQIDCTAYDFCDVCYPENLRLLFEKAQLKLENRIFKISASKYMRMGVNLKALSPEDEYLQNSFVEFRNALEHELDINCIIDRFYKHAQIIGESMDALQKTFDDSKLKELITQCEVKLIEKSPETMQDIQKHEEGSLKDVSQLIEDKDNKEDDLLRPLLQKFMKKKCGNFRNEFEEKIMKLIKDLRDKNYNQELANLTKNMFFKDYLNEESFENKIDNFIFDDINVYKVKDLKKENVDFSKFNIDNIILDKKLEKPKNKLEIEQSKTIYYKFLKSSKNVIVEIFKIAKKAFKIFTESFKKKAEKVVEEVKETISFTVKIAKELHLRHMIGECRKMKLQVEDKRKIIRNKINNHVDLMNEKLIEMDNEDVKNDNFGNIIADLTDSFPNVWNLKELKNELYEYLNGTGSSDLSQKITEHFAEEYRNKYLGFADIDKFDIQMKDKMDKLCKKINDKKFYIKEEAIDLNIDDPMTPEQYKIEMKQKRSIKTSEMMKQLQSSTNDMHQILNDITNKLNEGIDKFILYMKNYSF